MAERADLFIHPRQGTDYVWLAGITKYIIDQDWHDKKFIAENVKNFDEYSTMLEKYTLDYTEEITGISKETLKEMARMVCEADGTCILWGMGVTQNTGGKYNICCHFKFTACYGELSSSWCRRISITRS